MRTGWMTFLLAAALLCSGSAALAQGTGYDLSWWTVDGGGVTAAAGGGYALYATAGQPDAAALVGGGYTLAGGFWPAAPGPRRHVYLPLLLR